MSSEKAQVVLDKVLGYIMAKELTDDQKKQMTTECIDNYNNFINPGWLKYRKSVSTNEAFV